MTEEQKPIETLADFVKIAIDNKNVLDVSYLYRGQREDKPLIPKLLRRKHFNSKELLVAERLIFNEFKRKSVAFLNQIPGNDLEWLTIAQHFGLETRLLDWTENALTALWFCVNKPPEKNTNGVVYCLSFLDSLTKPIDEIDIKNPFEIITTKIYRPSFINSRIANQASVFTIHKVDLNNPNVINIDMDDSADIAKYIISGKKFESIKSDLNTLGINSSTVFPDLGGLCLALNEMINDKELWNKIINSLAETVDEMGGPEAFAENIVNKLKNLIPPDLGKK